MSDAGAERAGGRNRLEELTARVPGYRGYKEKEERREADKLVREQVARHLDSAHRTVEDMELTLSTGGDISLLGSVDNTLRKLRAVRDRFRFADYGYAGVFDAVQVKSSELEELHRIDGEAVELAAGLEKLAAALAAESPSFRTDMDTLDDRVEAMDELFRRRENVLTAAGG